MMKPFLKKLLGFIVICFGPFLVLLLGGYLYYDPFKVLHKFDNSAQSTGKLPFIYKNRDYVSTELFLKNYPSYKYNAFIFGSSRSLSFQPDSWKKYLQPGDVPYAFDAGAESVYGIYTKLKFLDEKKVKIDKALIILCRDWSFQHDGNHRGHLFIKDPAVSGESKLLFQYEFLDAYLDKNFLKAFYNYKLTHKFKKWMTGILLDKEIVTDSVSNAVRLYAVDSLINVDPKKYYEEKKDAFYPRKGERVDSVNRINSKHRFMLSEIKRILEKNNTSYQVICSPLYEQIKFAPADMEILKNTFGSHLYDFTGKNKFTDSVTNFYEVSHFRTAVGDSILNIIYQPQTIR